MSTKQSALIYIGRFCPLHHGHETVIRDLKEFSDLRTDHPPVIVVIGSINSPLTIRNMFSYHQRRDFIKKVFPDISLIGVPDVLGDDKSWFQILDDILSVAGIDPLRSTYYGGSIEDVDYLHTANRITTIINRFGPVDVSATEVRDALIEGRNLQGLIPPEIIAPVSDAFRSTWERLRHT